MFEKISSKIKDISVNRTFIAVIVLLAMYMFVLVKLFSVQVVNSSEDATLTEQVETPVEDGYRTYTMYTNPVRGLIYDRDGDLLAYNESVYNVELINSAGFENNAERNAAIYELIKLLDKYNLKREFDFPMIVNEEGKLEYTVSDNALLRFLKNCYGLMSVNDLSEEQKNATPDELFDYLCHGTRYLSIYGIDTDKYTLEEALEICCYRYQLFTNYPSYNPIRLVSNISDEFRIILLENMALIPCVEVTKSYNRVYNDAEYFSHIIGYIGKINETELLSLSEEYDNMYNANSIVGKIGVEKNLDNYLQGTLGEVKITVNKLGQVVKKEIVSNPIDGGDLYLTVDREAQIAGYNIVKKNVAAILMSKIVNSYSYGSKGKNADDITIPIYEVFNQFINNNLIDIKSFEDGDNTEAENRVYNSFLSYKDKVIARMQEMMKSDYTVKYKELADYDKKYCDYIYNKLRSDWDIITVNLDYDSSYFVNYNAGEMSLSTFINNCIEFGNINTVTLGLDDGYYEPGEIYDLIYTLIIDKITNDPGFYKLMYRALIFDNTISGRDLCLIMLEQNVIKYDDDTYQAIKNYQLSPYDFVIRKINNLELTPAMIALKPYTGSLIATDPLTGDVICMCSYPGYDNNLLTNSIDIDYYNKISNDLSTPMFSSCTQSRTNTGSTFKPLSAVMGITEGVISTEEHIRDEVKFTKIDPSPSCWASYGHGSQNVSVAIQNSCNYFFYEVAYRLSTTSKKEYSDEKGMNYIRKYASLFGFDSTSGVEVSEVEPIISDRDAVRTAIGYGHRFAPIQIARYATTIANKGTCYDLTLWSKVMDKEGNTLAENQPDIHHSLDTVAGSTWNAVHRGMYLVVNGGGVKEKFKKSGLIVAGKTGTGQVSLNEPNNALFISFAPHDNPKISVIAVIPNGYSSGNATTVVGDFYNFYFGNDNAEALLSGKRLYAGKPDTTIIND